MSRYVIDRRAFLTAIGAAGVGAIGLSSLEGCGAAAGGGGGSKSSGPISLAGLNPLSGPYAQGGTDTDSASKLTVEHLGQVNGEKVKYVSLNSQGKVDVGQRVVRDAMNKGTRFFFGETSSDICLAVSDVIASGNGVFFCSGAADEITGTKCKKSTFRWTVPAYGSIRETVVPLLKKNPSLKRWYAITPNYVFGQSMLTNAKEVLSNHGAKLVGNSFHSLDETQFSSYISNAIAAKPDVLLLLNFGSQNTNTVKQAVSFGVKNKIKVVLTPWSEGLSEFKGIGADALDGMYFGCQYWHRIDTPENKKFVHLVQKTLGQPPDYEMAAGHAEGRLLAEGIKKAGSTDPKKVIAALEGYEYEGVTGSAKIRSDNHQVESNFYLLKGKQKSKMADKNDFMEIISHGKSFEPASHTQCKL